MSQHTTEAERGLLLRAAREAIQAALEGRAPLRPASAAGLLLQHRACFVTLHLEGALRGCIGTLTAREPLLEAVLRHARAAAFEDRRFSPVTANEEPRLHLEISVLTELTPLVFQTPEEVCHRLGRGIDGVVLRGSGLQATFLPQVWDQLPDPETFLEHLSRKAGRPGLWRSRDAEILTYQVEAFEE